jgi:hypothetical protein
MSMTRRFLAVSSVVAVVILVVVLSALGAFVLLSLSDDADDRYGAATPEEAVTKWVEAYDRNDWAGSLDHSILHFAPAEVRYAQANLGDLTTTLRYNDVKAVAEDNITDKIRAYFEQELDQLSSQPGAPTMTDYAIVTYVRTSFDIRFGTENETEYCVVVMVDDRWYKTFIIINDFFWSNFEPTFLWVTNWDHSTEVMNDNDVWNIVMVDCLGIVRLDRIAFEFQFWADGHFCTLNYWSGINPGDVPVIGEWMTAEQIENASTYRVGVVDIGGDGFLSLGDYLYIVMDEGSGDNAKLPSGSMVEFTITVSTESIPVAIMADGCFIV